MTVSLADGSQLVSSSEVQCTLHIGDLPFPLSARVVDNLSHQLVLGMDWLQAHNPTIDWLAYTMPFLQASLRVECLPTKPVARVSICSLQSLAHAVHHGATAWLATLHPVEAVAMEAKAPSGGGDAPQNRWSKLCAEYSHIFEDPGTPAERKIKHHIQLKEGAEVPARRVYRMSPTELAEVRR